MDDNPSQKFTPSVSEERQGEFVKLLSQNHRHLLGYVRSMVASREDAEDVLQRACANMWSKFGTFETGTDFMAWASTFAFYEAKNFLRMASRSKLVFNDELLAIIADERRSDMQQSNRLHALEDCISKLTARNLELIRLVYTDRVEISRLAATNNLSTRTLYNKLHLIRKSLAACVRDRLAEGGLR